MDPQVSWNVGRAMGRENMDGSGIIEECREEVIDFIFKKERSKMMRTYGGRASSLPMPRSPKRGMGNIVI